MKAFMNYISEIYHLLGDEKKKLPFIIFIFLISSLLDAIGVGLIGPYVSFLIDPSLINGTFNNMLSIQDWNLDNRSMLILISFGLVLIFLMKTLAGILILWVIATYSYRQQVILRSKLMQSFQSMHYIDYIRRNSSEYIYSIQVLAATYTGKILMVSLKMISDIFIIFFIIVILGFTNVYVLLVLLTLLIVVSWVFDKFIRNNLESYGKKTNLASVELVKGVVEGINGMKELRVLGKQDFFYNIVRNSSKEYAANNKMTDILSSLPRYFIEFVVILFLTLIVLYQLIINGDILSFIPVVAVFGFASLRLVPAVNSIASGMVHLRFNKNTISILKNDIDGSNYKAKKNEQISQSNFELIEFKNISYKYPETSKNAISNISLSIKKGESIGIIGSSGSGKTTLIDLLIGHLNPDNGDIFYNNVNIKKCKREWQNNIAYLPQEIFLIDDTLKKNIALGVEDNMIDSSLVQEALKIASMDEFVSELPNGVLTLLGEGGVNLSGGQRQRVALARSIYHRRNVLILDEATSSLDSITERNIIDEMKCLKGEITMIVIAHRYNTLEACDRIYRVENGIITEIITYEELILNNNID